MTAGAVSLKKSHDIVILSFCNIVKGVKGQANCGISCSSLIIRKNFSIDNVMNSQATFQIVAYDNTIIHIKRGMKMEPKGVGNSANQEEKFIPNHK